jgi:hypothetical protein
VTAAICSTTKITVARMRLASVADNKNSKIFCAFLSHGRQTSREREREREIHSALKSTYCREIKRERNAHTHTNAKAAAHLADKNANERREVKCALPPQPPLCAKAAEWRRRSLAGWLAVPRVCYGTDLLNALRAA